MADLLTRLLEWGLGIFIIGLVIVIGVAWFLKIKNQLLKKTKQGKKDSFFKEVGRQ